MLTKELSKLPAPRLSFIEPMYARAVSELPEGNLWSYEAKLDGYRCLVAKGSRGDVVLWSRRGNLFTARFPEIARACQALPADTMIDGEVVAIDGDGRMSFNALQHSRSKTPLHFYAFDVLVHRGRSTLRLPLEERRNLLVEALAKVQYPVIRSTPFDAKPADLIRAAKELELEGLIAKRKDSLYEPARRSGAWLKYKINRSQEFVVGGYTPGNPFDALIVGYYKGAELKFVGKVRNGFVPHVRREVFTKFTGLETTKCPFANLPEERRTVWALTASEMKECRWLKPELVAQIEFTEWTPDEHLRHASFAGLRDDKEAREIVRE
jgi:DNA ligase D-like protein (predicted ligase)